MTLQPEDTFVFFYGHDRKKHGDFAIFSNFYPAKFTDENGHNFLHSEQYLMWRKATLFNDEEMATKILKATKPADCKKYGRQVKNFDQTVWSANAESIMVDGLLLKFNQNPELKQILLDTGDRILVEASPRDRIWGIGMGKTNKDRLDPSKWKGTNLLGKCLMKTRSNL